MKKLIASLAVAFLLVAGLVAGTSTTATAGPYSGTISTTTNARATPPTIRVGQRARVRVNIQATQGNGRPRGAVQVTFSSRDGKVLRVYTRTYDGNARTYGFPALPRAARYTVVATFIPFSQSVYRSSASATFLRVVRR